MKINAKALKRQLSINDHKKICKELGIPIYEENNKEIKYWTGDKNKDPYKGSPGKLVFYKNTGVYFGYTACSSYDIISLCQKRLCLLGKNYTFLDAVQFISDICGLQIEAIQRHKAPDICNWQEGLEKFVRFRNTGSSFQYYNPSVLNGLEERFPDQWILQGISPDSMRKYKIGYYPRTQATTIPVFENQGNLLGIRVRNWNPEELEYGKYRPLTLLDGTTYKFPTNNIFYGLNYNWPEIERTKTVMLGEGEKFVLKCDTWFKERNVALAMFGGNLGLYRRNQLIKMGVNRIIYVVDNDYIGEDDSVFDAWEKKINKFVDLWSGLARVEIVWDSGLDLLGPKENATDKDLKVFYELYSRRIKI